MSALRWSVVGSCLLAAAAGSLTALPVWAAVGAPTAATGAVAPPTVEPGTAAKGDALRVQVTRFGVDGQPRTGEAVDVEVVYFQRAMSNNEPPKQTRVERRSTRAGGWLVLPPLAPRALRSLRFTEAGRPVEVRLPASGRAQIGVYEKALTDDDIEMDLRANLSVRDGGTSTWLEIKLTTRQPGARAWSRKSPLLLPMLAPVVRGAVIDRGAITPATKNIDVQTPDAVEVIRAADGLALVGTVAPGRPISLRIRYGLAIKATSVDLGLRSVVGKTHFAVATIATPPVLIDMSVSRPARVAEHREGRERYTGMSIVHPLRRGEVATVRLIGFPVKSEVPGRLLGGIAGAMALLFGALAFRRRET